ncbi:MAG: D-2-hydroxyacid dehydrogenase, partial [Lachnospirales bacterium]
MNIVILDGYTLFPEYEYWKDFEKFGNVTLYDRTPYDETIKRIGNAEIVITNKTVIDKHIIENTNIKYIGVLATGYNIIDIKLCREKGIIVCNIPSYSTKAVAQLTFAMLLEVTNKVYIHNESVKKGDWSNCADFSYTVSPLTELS